jgi:hypothetical protein
MEQPVGRERHPVFEQRSCREAVEKGTVGADEDELDRTMGETLGGLQQRFLFH